MASNLKRSVRIVTDADGRVRLKQVYRADASARRRIAKAKRQRIVTPARAETVGNFGNRGNPGA